VLSGLIYGLLFLIVISNEPSATGGTAAISIWFGEISGPILTGMIGTFLIQEAKPEEQKKPPATKAVFRMAMGFCWIYWLIVLITIVSWQDMDIEGNFRPLSNWLQDKLVLLAIIQVVLFSLLAFFFKSVKIKPQKAT